VEKLVEESGMRLSQMQDSGRVRLVVGARSEVERVQDCLAREW
jgi:hypothetical protein